MVLDDHHIQDILKVVDSAAKEILSVYSKAEVSVKIKNDGTPLTEADALSHQILTRGLSHLFPELPLISEESRSVTFVQRKAWKYFWLLDPLDGTKEFIKRNGEFTINLALIHKGVSIFGVVCLPAKGCVYIGQRGKGAFKRTNCRDIRRITAKKNYNGRIIVARSRSHAEPQEQTLLSYFKKIDTINAGSSLKFCYIAEGKADIYLRSGPTMEWDTAAGQCLAESAGAVMRNLDGSSFDYNKESLKNSGFVCVANRQILNMIFKGMRKENM